MKRFLLLAALFVSFFNLAMHHADAEFDIQERFTATPAQVDLSENITIAADEPIVTLTATLTPSPTGLAILEARTEANVRSQPSTEAELLGTIHVGERYTVLGRYFRWIQFQYNPNLNQGIGWVFDELVTIIGDESSIPVLTDENLNDPFSGDDASLQVTQTALAITLTPGGLLTATAATNPNSNRIPDIGFTGPNQVGIPLPTFTFPANLAGVAPTLVVRETAITQIPDQSARITGIVNANNIPPIVPIIGFGGLGILGLLMASIKRT